MIAPFFPAHGTLHRGCEECHSRPFGFERQRFGVAWQGTAAEKRVWLSAFMDIGGRGAPARDRYGRTSRSLPRLPPPVDTVDDALAALDRPPLLEMGQVVEVAAISRSSPRSVITSRLFSVCPGLGGLAHGECVPGRRNRCADDGSAGATVTDRAIGRSVGARGAAILAPSPASTTSRCQAARPAGVVRKQGARSAGRQGINSWQERRLRAPSSCCARLGC